MKTSKTVISPEVQMLQTQLAAQKKQLLATKMMLKQIEQANKPPFIETKVGRGYLTVVKTITKPFVSMHENAELSLSDPDRARAQEIVKIGKSLLAKANKCKGNDQPQSKGLAVALAKFSLSVSSFHEKTNKKFLEVEELLQAVASEIMRLRPAATPEQEKQAEELKAQLATLAQQVEAAQVTAVEESTQAKE